MNDVASTNESVMKRLISEARRRHLFRAAGLYVAGAFVILQVADIAGPSLGLPEAAITYLLIAMAVGFPLVLLVLWIVDLSGDRQQAPGRLMDAVITAIALGVGYMYLERLTGDSIIVPQAERVASNQQRTEEPKSTVLNNSIAVLPFENLSPDPDNAYFAAGIHEEVLNRLAKIEDLTIIARTSVLSYAGTDKKIPQIAQELNVGTVMEGSVRYAGDQVRITAQLIEAESGAHLWSEAYDRHFKDIFEIQTDIALQITDAMKVEFKVGERELISKAPTENLEAYAHFVKAQAFVSGNPPDLPSAIREYDEAIALDPEFALALATKAVIHSYAIYVTPPGYVLTETAQARNIQLAREYAERALAVDPNQGNAYLALANLSQADHDWQQAYAYSKRAYELSRNVLTANAVGQWSLRIENSELALQYFEEAMQLDPLNSNVPRFVSPQYGAKSDWENSKRFAQQARLMAPETPDPYLLLSYLAAIEGSHKNAIDYLRLGEELSDGALNGFNLTGAMWSLSIAGLDEEVERLAPRFYELESQQLLDPFNLSQGYTALGDLDRGFELLHQVIDTNFPTGPITTIALSPECVCLALWHGDPRWDEALEKVQRLGIKK
jgi:TolB-like protein